MPGQSITTLKGYGSSGPAIDDIPNYYLYVGDDASLEIPLSGLSDGGGGSIAFDVTSSNESVISFSEVDYAYPGSQGILTLNADTSAPGRAVVNVKLTNGNMTDESVFGFNSMRVSFIVEVIDVVTSITKEVSDEIEIYPNPADADKFTVVLPAFQRMGNVSILNALGQPVLRLTAAELLKNQIIIDTSGWKPGLYLLNISTESRDFTRKIMVH